jgi:DNA-binding NarL/FixJ family response regulator
MKILLIDHHELFREGLRHVLQKLPSGISELLETGDWQQGLDYVEQHPDLDVVLLELTARGCKGAQSVKFFRQRYPHIPLVVVSGDERFQVIKTVLNSGAHGFVGKSSPSAMLLGALHLVFAGNIYVPPQMFRHLSNAEEYRLTKRQIEILGCLSDGLSNKEIAEKFELAEGTVKVHVAAVYQALRVKSRKEAAGLAAQLGLVTQPRDECLAV